MPLATELTSLVLQRKCLRELEELQNWLRDLESRISASEGGADDSSSYVLNIEQLFDYAVFDQEMWRVRQQLAPVGRMNGETPWSRAEGIEGWLDLLEDELRHVLWEAQCAAKRSPVEKFTKHLAPTDVVLTFNYDTLVETTLATQGKHWNHGLNDQHCGGITILKMHGSVDWILLERRPEQALEQFVKLFSKRDANVTEHGGPPPNEREYHWELWRARDASTCRKIYQMDEGGLSTFRYELGFAGLGRYKELHKLPGAAQTWGGAFTALKEAEEVYVIGFSMSPYDALTRFHFTARMRTREKQPDRVTIIDPNALSLAKGFHAVFGDPLTLIAKKAESVDWERLLG